MFIADNMFRGHVLGRGHRVNNGTSSWELRRGSSVYATIIPAERWYDEGVVIRGEDREFFWLLVVGCWLLVFGYWLLVVG
jgi:hypothetical protein